MALTHQTPPVPPPGISPPFCLASITHTETYIPSRHTCLRHGHVVDQQAASRPKAQQSTCEALVLQTLSLCFPMWPSGLIQWLTPTPSEGGLPEQLGEAAVQLLEVAPGRLSVPLFLPPYFPSVRLCRSREARVVFLTADLPNTCNAVRFGMCS
jgi:hypothetical protein